MANHFGIGLAMAACLGPAMLEGGEALMILARGPWPHIPATSSAPLPRELRTWVFRDEESLRHIAGDHGESAVARTLGVASIDFAKQMVVAVGDGTQPLVGVSGGGSPSAPLRVEITGAALAEDGSLAVHWRRARRGEEILTAPLALALLERTDGVVTFARTPDDADPPREDGRKLLLARALWPDGWSAESASREWVVRNAGSLVDPRMKAPEPVLERLRCEAAARYARALHVEAVDFDRQMVIGVSGGVQRSGGYRVEITRVEADAPGKILTVRWTLHAPEGFATAVLTHPAEVILVDQFDGDVKFVREPEAR